MDEERIRQAYINKEPGRDLLFARFALHKAARDTAEVLGQTPTSLESFCHIIHQLDAISERLKATARVMTLTDILTIVPAEKSDAAPTSD
jgi:hypothetical protein